MDTKLLLVFIGLNIANVIIQTVKSIATVKCGKGVAAIVNAVAYGLYTVVTVYLMCELSLGLKALIVALCNLVGVYVVKWAEERLARTSCGKSKQLFLTQTLSLFGMNYRKQTFLAITFPALVSGLCSTSTAKPKSRAKRQKRF